jgi:hypothetical protein
LIYVPDRGRRYLQFGLIMPAMVTVVAVPMIHRANREPPSKALLLQDFSTNLTVLLAVLGGATPVAYAIRVARDRSVAVDRRSTKPLRDGELKTPTRRRLAAGWVPRPDAAEAFERDPGDVSGRGIGHPREDDVGSEIGVGEALEDLGGTTLGDARGAVDDEVFEQPPLVCDGRRDRERDAGVAAEVPQFPLVREGGKDDLISIEPDPRGGDLRPSIVVKRDHVRDRVAVEQGAGGLGERDSSHGSMLAVKPGGYLGQLDADRTAADHHGSARTPSLRPWLSWD